MTGSHALVVKETDFLQSQVESYFQSWLEVSDGVRNGIRPNMLQLFRKDPLNTHLKKACTML